MEVYRKRICKRHNKFTARSVHSKLFNILISSSHCQDSSRSKNMSPFIDINAVLHYQVWVCIKNEAYLLNRFDLICRLIAALYIF
jgi:hypothetical protein